jgi:hypothetical protein
MVRKNTETDNPGSRHVFVAYSRSEIIACGYSPALLNRPGSQLWHEFGWWLPADWNRYGELWRYVIEVWLPIEGSAVFCVFALTDYSFLPASPLAVWSALVDRAPQLGESLRRCDIMERVQRPAIWTGEHGEILASVPAVADLREIRLD